MSTAEQLVLCVDTETTGSNRELDEIRELAAVPLAVRGGGRGGAHQLPGWAALCRTSKPSEPLAVANHGIRHGGGRLPASGVLRRHWPAAVQVVAYHYAEFDQPFVARSLRAAGLPCEFQVLCTYRAALHVWPEAPAHGLQPLRHWLALRPALPRHQRRAHRALFDAACCAALLRRLLRERTLAELVAYATAPLEQMTIRIGQNRGRAWRDVDTGFLHWMLRTMRRDPAAFDPDTRHTALIHLRRRGVLQDD